MSRDRLKNSLQDRGEIPSADDFMKLTAEERAKMVANMIAVTTNNMAMIQENRDDEKSFDDGVCLVCKATDGVKIKQTQFSYAYFCKAHMPVKKEEPAKFRRSIEDIFCGPTSMKGIR